MIVHTDTVPLSGEVVHEGKPGVVIDESAPPVEAEES